MTQKTKIRKRPVGWRQEPERHRAAALKGIGIKTGKIPPISEKEIQFVQSQRTPKAHGMDNKKEAKMTFSKRDPKTQNWKKRPGKYDIKGVDGSFKGPVEKKKEDSFENNPQVLKHRKI